MVTRELTLKNGGIIEFDGDIRSHLVAEDLHICVISDTRGKKTVIACINEEGELLWVKPTRRDAALYPNHERGGIYFATGARESLLNPYTGEEEGGLPPSINKGTLRA